MGSLTSVRARRRNTRARRPSIVGATVLIAAALILPINARKATAVAATPASAASTEAGLRGRDVRGTGILPNFAASGTNLVRLQSGAFDPLAQPAPAGAAIAHIPDAGLPQGVPLYFLAQVANGEFAAATNAITAAGASVVSIVPDDTYVVRGTIAQRSAFKLSPAIRWSAYLQPAWRVPVAANGLPNLLDLAGTRTYRVYAFRTDSRAATLASALGALPGVHVVRDGGSAVDVRASAAVVGAIAAIPFVQWVSTKPIAVPLNYDARWVVDSGVRDLFTTTAANGAAARLNGAGVTAADADTPLNYTNNSAGFAHAAFRDGCDSRGLNCALADFTQQQPGNDDATMEAVQVNHPGSNHRKMAAYFDLGGVGVETISADADAHGSHTAGTIDGDAGTPLVYNGQDGLAPAARHVHQEILDPSGGLATPTDYYELFRQAYRPSAPGAVPNTGGTPDPAFYGGAKYDPLHDARTHNNSYGLTIPEVDPFSEAIVLDQFVWDHEDMAIAVAAGNSGPQIGTIGSPAVAKNDFTSAASSNGRQPMAAIDSVTNFSSHGPTGDGRYGVTLTTPGEIVVSVKGGTSDGYHYLQGTSMSTPVLTGALTLARQYFWSGYGPAAGKGFAVGEKSASRKYDPSAALLKATLVSGATRMRGWYSGDDGSTLEAQQRGQYPSAGQGFGLVNLDRSLSFKGGPLTSWFHDVYRSSAESFGVSGGATTTRSYPIQVGSGAPLNLALAWTDAPDAMPAGTPALVNDLQLTLTDPNGKVYVGNNFDSRANPAVAVAETPSGNAAPDTLNNVERVSVAHPAAGTWTVKVAASRVAIGEQGFALAANGVIGTAGAGNPVVGPPHQVDTVPGSPHITNLKATPISADTVKLTFTTDEPTRAVASGTVTNAVHTFGDDYELTSSGYYGVDTPPVETSPTYAGVRVLSRAHEITLTGFGRGTKRTFLVTATDIEGSPPTSATITFTTPRNTFQPASSDEGQLSKSGDPAGFQWRTGKQFYAGATPASTTAAADALLGAFMFRVPRSFDPTQITGAEVQLQSAHDVASAVTDDPSYHLDLLADSVKPAWGTQTYDQIESTAKLARLNPVTALHTGVQRYHFAFSCTNLAALKASLANVDARGMRAAPFRWDVTNPGSSLFSMEFGFNRRSHGLDLRPKLVLFTAADPAAPRAAPCDANAPAPTLTNVRIHPGDSATSWTVTWRTNTDADSLVLFRPVGSTTWRQVGSRGLSRIHQIEVRGISPTQNYEFGVRSTGCNGKATTDDNKGRGYAFRIAPVPTQAQSPPRYFHGTASDDANRQAGTPTATFNATAPASGAADATQTGNVLLADSSLAGDSSSVYWVAPSTGTFNGQLHIRWYWSTNNPDAVVSGDVEDVTIWADPNLTTHTGTLIGSASVPVTLGLTPTLNTALVPIHGSVAQRLLIQVSPHFIDTSAAVTVHYNSVTTDSSFTTPVGAPPPPPNRPVVGPQPPASAGNHDLNLAAVRVDAPATAADVAAGTALNCPS